MPLPLKGRAIKPARLEPVRTAQGDLIGEVRCLSLVRGKLDQSCGSMLAGNALVVNDADEQCLSFDRQSICAKEKN